MDEKKDYVGLPPCCTEQGRITAHGALWALDVRTGKVIGKATFQPPTKSGMLFDRWRHPVHRPYDRQAGGL